MFITKQIRVGSCTIINVMHIYLNQKQEMAALQVRKRQKHIRPYRDA